MNDVVITPTLKTYSYKFSMDEFKKAWAMISSDPAITLKEIAFHLGFSTSKAFALTKYIAQCGFIKRKAKGTSVFTVLIPYVEVLRTPLDETGPTIAL